MAKKTKLAFDQALRIFKDLKGNDPVSFHNRAIIALFIVTGIPLPP